MTLEEQIHALSEEYRDHIRPDLEMLRAHLDLLGAGKRLDTDLEALQRLAHMQSGSAGSFGFHRLAECARATDQAITQKLSDLELLACLEVWQTALIEALC